VLWAVHLNKVNTTMWASVNKRKTSSEQNKQGRRTFLFVYFRERERGAVRNTKV
jgi:hypothetical protein